MGVVLENLLTKGFSGKIGDEIVFRQVGNRTMFAKRPRKRKTLTPNQQAQRGVFLNAVRNAKAALLDPATKAEYQLLAKKYKIQSAYSAAVADYLKAPEISVIFTDRYKGAVGDVIFVSMVDDFKVKAMTVTIQLADGTVLESGDAVFDLDAWKYVATKANAAVQGTKITAVVTDRPGNTDTKEKVL